MTEVLSRKKRELIEYLHRNLDDNEVSLLWDTLGISSKREDKCASKGAQLFEIVVLRSENAIRLAAARVHKKKTTPTISAPSTGSRDESATG